MSTPRRVPHDAIGPEDRLMELLAGRALGDLTPDEASELERLLAATPAASADLDDFERAIGATTHALLAARGLEPMPADVKARVGARLQAHVANEAGRAGAPSLRIERGAGRSQVGWWLAAAALVLAVVGWWPRLVTQRGGAEPSDWIVAQWSPGPDPLGASVSGEVRWSNATQSGRMTFTGLAKNDPSKSQYQLWIFDKAQSEATPVDGGVFDVDASGTVTIPIDAKLKVETPYLFAITVEKPGGVVVSSRERLALVAPVKA